jgi:hypothetical protein
VCQTKQDLTVSPLYGMISVIVTKDKDFFLLVFITLVISTGQTHQTSFATFLISSAEPFGVGDWRFASQYFVLSIFD